MGTDSTAESLSITRLEGSRWRGGRLWSREWGSGSVKESEARASALWIDAGTWVSSVVYRGPAEKKARCTGESRHG